MNNTKNIWLEFETTVFNQELGFNIPLCGLCGNSGVLDTTTSAIWKAKPIGIRAFCICPNGRAKRKTATNQKKWGGSSVISNNNK